MATPARIPAAAMVYIVLAAVGCGARSGLPLLEDDRAAERDPGDDAAKKRCSAERIQLALGNRHTCVRTLDCRVRCWGDAYWGQLGYANTANIGDDETPASVSGVDVGGNVLEVAAGENHTCVLLDTGTVRCWGDPGHGRLGYGNRIAIGDDETPASVGDIDLGGEGKIVQLVAGDWHTCALFDSGAVRCWGDDFYNQLGDGAGLPLGDDEPPSAAGNVDVGGRVVELAAGGVHTCARLDTGSVRCWGLNSYGQLGYPGPWQPTPALAGDVDVGGRVVQIAAGSYHTCAVIEGGGLTCWGSSYLGALGYGVKVDIGDDETPASAGVVDVGGRVVQVEGGARHTCALMDTGSVRCWGYAIDGQLGYGNRNDIGDDEAPASAGDVNLGGSVLRVETGGHHSCALMVNGALRCWGAPRMASSATQTPRTSATTKYPQPRAKFRLFDA